MMIACPKCKNKTIPYWSKWRSSHKRPVTCSSCGTKLYTDYVLSSFWGILEQLVFFVGILWVFYELTLLSFLIFIAALSLADYLRITLSPLEIKKE